MSTLDRPRPKAATTASPLSLTPLSDAALAKLVANGGDGAFEVLYERYRADLSRYCRALLRNPEDAEEAFQGTMLNALRALRNGDGGRTMRPWLYRIAHNQCASMIRARRPSSALSPDQPSLLDPPEEQAAIAEQIRHLRADLGSLPALQRSALVMREMSGLSHRSIAAALAVEPADARQLVYEARRSLDECRIGRESGCDEVRGQIADGDRRRLRSRRVRAHLRGCEHCSAYVASQTERRRGYAALAPAMPAAAGKQVFERLMGSSPAATAGSGAIGIPGGVAGTLAGLAAGFNPGTSAKAWARLPEGAATGMAGAGATAGVALLSLALTALLLNGGNAAYGSWSEPAAPAPPPTVLEVAVVGPPGTADIGYRAAVAPEAPAASSSAPTANEPEIAIRGAAISARSSTPPPPPPAPAPAAGTSITLAELPGPLPPDRPAADAPRPRLIDAPVSASIDTPSPAPAPADDVVAVPVDSAAPPAPAEPEPVTPDPPAPVADPAPVTTEVGSGPDPEPVAEIAESPATDVPAPSKASEEPASSPESSEPDAVGSGPDPEPVAANDAATVETEAEKPRDESSPKAGSGPDPEPETEVAAEPEQAERNSQPDGDDTPEESTDSTAETPTEEESSDDEPSEDPQLSELEASTEVCP